MRITTGITTAVACQPRSFVAGCRGCTAIEADDALNSRTVGRGRLSAVIAVHVQSFYVDTAVVI